MASLAIYTILEADESQKARPKTLIAIDIDIYSHTLFLSINCATNIYCPEISHQHQPASSLPAAKATALIQLWTVWLKLQDLFQL